MRASALTVWCSAYRHRSIAASELSSAGFPESIKEALPGLRDELSWLHADPAALVTERLDVVATADNDANLAALGEAAFGAGRGLENFIYVKAVDGLGAGLFLNGQLYRGARGLAGELAHVQIDPDGPWCSCGGRGCLARIFGGFVRAFIESTYGTKLELRRRSRTGNRGGDGHPAGHRRRWPEGRSGVG